ncbi:hypothetical protein [Actinomadura sp. HBU206391]|uniref:hypothetical protein n=1 Tax=Actinomadura sp. HBU206391 TaxID=2731692 RepID=UPI00164F8193|nr:hypothetical protein [Actinomadura sp. HBU206391]MBC6457819.1 hypothetical protein [Actinomadura sp. HBU206391]
MVLAVALACMAVVAAVIVLAMGKGGELAEAHPDHPPLVLPGHHRVTGTDAALLSLPMGVWGYHIGITDAALDQLAYALTQRDTRIAVLEQQLEQLRLRQSGAVEEPIQWNGDREPQNTWSPPPGELPSWSAPELPAGPEVPEKAASEDGAEADDQRWDR